MKKLLKLISALSIVIMLTTSCAYNHFDYIGGAKQNLNNYKLSVKGVKVNLKERKFLPINSPKQSYPNEEQVTSIVKEMLIEKLHKKGLYSDSKNNENILEFELNIDYSRLFIIFTSDIYAGSRLNGYKITLYKSGKVIAYRQDNNQYGASFGFKGNLKKMSKELALKADRDDERKEIEVFVNSFVKDLEMIGK